MVFIDTPPPAIDAVAEAWGVDLPGIPTRLHGGEESAAYRIGSYVVRVGPSWRSSAMLEWSNRVALAAGMTVPEAVGPEATPTGATVVRFDGRPVTVWPFVEGAWADEGEHFADAAQLLARVHRALDSADVGPRPPEATPLAEAPDLDDSALDEWLVGFAEEHPHVHPQHGDYYRGNLLANVGSLVALVDWDEAFVGPPEVGLANGAWEWGGGLWGEGLERVLEFVDLYVAAGGTAPGLTEIELRQLVRARLRWEVRYSRLRNPDDDYEARQLLVYERLRLSSCT